MTREELKAHCEKQMEMCEMWAISKGEKPSGKIYEEHKLILELLDQQPIISTNNDEPITVIYPTIVCDDAVSREVVYQLLMNMASSAYGFEEIRRIVDELPSVTQKSGKWTLMYEPKNMAVCSECGKSAYMYQDKTSAFCPNCGARMIEPLPDNATNGGCDKGNIPKYRK